MKLFKAAFLFLAAVVMVGAKIRFNKFSVSVNPEYRIVTTVNPSGNFGEGIAFYNNHVYKCFNDASPSRLLVNYDVTNRTAPVLKSAYTAKPNGATDIAVLSTDGIKTYAYVCYYTDESTNTFRVFDVTDDTQWVEVGGSSITDLPLFGTEVVVSTDGRYAYVGFDQAASTNSLRRIDVTVKSSPTVTTNILDFTDGARVNGLSLFGSTLCVTFEIGVPNSLRLVNTVTMSTMNNVSSDVASEPRESIFSSDGRYIFTGSWFEKTGAMAVDVSVPSVPDTISTRALPGSTIAIDRLRTFVFLGLDNQVAGNDTLIVLDYRDPLHPFRMNTSWNRATNVTGICNDGNRYVYVGGRSTTFGITIIDANEFR